ncbi:MAG: NHL repeat-containing protein, partial [Pseudomonadota bacterium]
DLAVPLAPSAAALFGPRGVCLHTNGSLWVADTGHHRLLGWRRIPKEDKTPADLVIGQPDFSREGRNAKGTPHAASLNVPTGVAAWGDGLAVADPWNHRVLLWRTTPTESGQPADIILGQQTADASIANHGSDRPTAASLHWPYGVSVIAGKLVVCDTGNRRVLVWNDPAETGQRADLVLGQRDFDTRDENAGGAVSAMSMRWPHMACDWLGRLAVADAGNNRVMLWEEMPTTDGAPATAMLGQRNSTDCDHNLAAYYPSSAALNMPYAAVAAGGRLAVADTANSRLVGWSDAAMGAEADRLTGQPDFAAKGDNRWSVAERDSLCWPYGLSALGDLVAIADSGNNRVLLWRLADAG